MRNPDRETIFRFKQFDVINRKSAMKVGTDGVLLGAWSFKDMPLDADACVMDVGAGTGLISLMLAQRFSRFKIDGVELSADAAEEAEENYRRSRWASRLKMLAGDFTKLTATMAPESYDLMISNPPFFATGALAPDSDRRLARHEGTLNFSSLLCGASKLLVPGGRIALVAPADMCGHITFEAELNGMKPVRICEVYTVPRKPARRVLIELMNMSGSKSATRDRFSTKEQISIHDANGDFSVEYENITKDFYLKF